MTACSLESERNMPVPTKLPYAFTARNMIMAARTGWTSGTMTD